MNKAIIISYLDDKYDYYKLKTTDGEFLISGTGQGVRRTDTILADASVEGAVLSRYDNPVSLEIAGIRTVLVGEDTEYEADMSKKDPVCARAAQLLSQLGLWDSALDLCKRAESETVQRLILTVTGKKVLPGDETTVGTFLAQLLDAMGADRTGDVMHDAVLAGILDSVNSPTVWFGEPTAQLEMTGLCAEVTFEAAPLCNDELAGILYNLLTAKIDGERNFVRQIRDGVICEKSITDTYERSLVFPYYEECGIRVLEGEFKDINKKSMHGFYIPGASLNHTYLNEYTTVDNVHYVFCALFDRHIRKWGRGIPVLYNARTGETTQLHDRMNMRNYAMLMSKDKKIYFTADENIYCYDIESGTKSIIYTETNGCALQEIPTITDDGRYLLFFYGTELAHRPDRAVVIDLMDGSCRTVLDTQWVHAHFDGSKNPFAGHFIINPKRGELINFLHGGPDNVKDRMWLLDTGTGRIWEPYKQQVTADGELAEALTHWVWSNDGKRLYFVRIRRDSRIDELENGICYINVNSDDGVVHVIKTARECIHSVPDFEDRMFISDTYNNEPDLFTSDIFLNDTKTGAEYDLFKIYINKQHPGHAHPQFSADGDRVLFAFTPDNTGVVCVCEENIDKYKLGMEKCDGI